MPIQYKVPGYLGNALLLVISLIIIGSDNVIIGVLMGALAVLNLFLIYKLDRFSREEVWLAHELEMAKMREQLLIAQTRIGELEAAPKSSSPHPETPA